MNPGGRPPVYVAGPFARDPDNNTRVAVMVARFATHKGFAPLVVHPSILAGAYGDDNHPEERDAGIECALSLLKLVADHPHGELWVIERDDGTLSEGTAMELEAWRHVRGTDAAVTRHPYWGWVQTIRRWAVSPEAPRRKESWVEGWMAGWARRTG